MSVEVFRVDESEQIGAIGWEKNEKAQLMPRYVDMSQSMNTEKLAENAVSLNLKLMKWRVAPNVDLNAVKDFKCLLLGSGTLGCNVARCLLVSTTQVSQKEMRDDDLRVILEGVGREHNNIRRQFQDLLLEPRTSESVHV
jgi:hypothetical protein